MTEFDRHPDAGDRRDRAVLAALPDDAPASPAQEERIVRRLRGAGLLRPPSRRWVRPLLGLAAALLLFTAGVGAGLRLATRRPAAPLDPTLRLQRAATEYVHAIAGVDRAGLDSAAAATASEVAVQTLFGATREVVRVAGPIAVGERVLAALATAPTTPDAAAQAVVWF